MFCADVEGFPVAILSIALPVAFADTVSLGGLKIQDAFAGSEPQVKVNVPADPLIVARLTVKLAVWPLEIVWLD